jgi:hypothetical protein
MPTRPRLMLLKLQSQRQLLKKQKLEIKNSRNVRKLYKRRKIHDF